MHDALAGRVLVRSDFRVPQLATVDLGGRQVLEVVSRGKHLLTRFAATPPTPPPGRDLERCGDDTPSGPHISQDHAGFGGPLTLHTHFRMDGTWHLYRPGDSWTGGPDWQVRAVLEVEDRIAVGFRLPVLDLLPTAEEARVVGHLGPDLLGPDWDAEEAVRRLEADPDREIGLALLDQRMLAGLGNLYRTELLFLRGVSPWARVRDAADLHALVDLGRRLLMANRSTSRQVTTGDTRRGRQHYAYERSGRPCLRCGTPIASAPQGAAPYERLTYWCPSCQPAPPR